MSYRPLEDRKNWILKEFVSEKLIFLLNLIISLSFYHRIVKIFLSSNSFIQKSLTKVWNNIQVWSNIEKSIQILKKSDSKPYLFLKIIMWIKLKVLQRPRFRNRIVVYKYMGGSLNMRLIAWCFMLYQKYSSHIHVITTWASRIIYISLVRGGDLKQFKIFSQIWLYDIY